jgi:16S rRNA (adenine1518-N6/adenine1519-N6)-dimethyltransferase
MRRAQESSPASILRKHGVRPRRSLGQNFLDDPGALQAIVAAAEISPTDVVLEVGTGMGHLTRQLARVAARVVSVEVDAALVEISRQALKEESNVVLLHGDILEISPEDLALPGGYLVAANIPYYITSAILRHLLETQSRPRRIVLTVQKEVALRISASPPNMSLLAVSVQVYGSVRIVAEIAAEAFHPKPKVNSAVVRIDCFPEAVADGRDMERFFRAAKAGFLQPRKMLRNSLAAGLPAAPGDVQAILNAAGIDGRRRAETLTVAEWLRLGVLLPRSD